MFSNLTVFKTAHAMAVHAGARQALIAQNVANADTPGYRARDLPSFAESFAPQRGEGRAPGPAGSQSPRAAQRPSIRQAAKTSPADRTSISQGGASSTWRMSRTW